MTDFLATNWLWIVAVIFFLAMHRRGHGCGMHGSHHGGSHSDHRPDGTNNDRSTS